ncbi:MAG TPA: sugar phosphate nucleotidyltransferase [Devosiaceae bacterium]|nr:sugar phosphate nucleotidyltransferase [Devosiaceae bacterium]
MLGIIPAAGRGSRIQPLGFSKELLPVGTRRGELGERPCAVSEYLLERMIAGGAQKLCFVIGPGKSDILEYYAAGFGSAATVYVVQPNPNGLCDAIFRAAALVRDDEPVLIGLPDTIWFPADGFAAMPDDQLSLLLFPVDRPERFDAVVLDNEDRVRRIEVKQAKPSSSWIWGAIKMPGHVFHALHALWLEPGRGDEYFGTLVNEFLARGGVAIGLRAGSQYVDVGTIDGYRAALALLDKMEQEAAPAPPTEPTANGVSSRYGVPA